MESRTERHTVCAERTAVRMQTLCPHCAHHSTETHLLWSGMLKELGADVSHLMRKLGPRKIVNAGV